MSRFPTPALELGFTLAYGSRTECVKNIYRGRKELSIVTSIVGTIVGKLRSSKLLSKIQQDSKGRTIDRVVGD